MESNINKNNVSYTVTYLIFIVASALVIVPLLWIIGNSFRPESEIGRYAELSLRTFLPDNATLENYIILFRDYPFMRYIFNTFFVAVAVTFFSLLLNSIAAFSFARIDFYGKNIIFTILLVTLIVPGEVLLLPSYMLIKRLSLMDNYLALILPALSGTFGIFYLKQCFMGVPRELEEAASIDGCRKIGILFKIFIPLAKPHLITLGLMTFMIQWDGFIWPITVITTPEKYLLQVGLNYLMGEHFSEWGPIFAGAMVCTIPVIVIFITMQKYYIEGIASVGIKG